MLRRWLRWLRLVELGLVCAGCASANSSNAWLYTPPPFGFYGMQCITQRHVVCLVDDEMNIAQCRRTVLPAIEEINKAVGREIYRFDGFSTFDGATALLQLNAGIYLIMGAKALPAETLGTTQTIGSDFAPTFNCIDRVVTRINPILWGRPYETAVLVHEMVHALGAGHTPDGGAFGSIMLPQVGSPTWRDHLTEFDIANLRRVYGTIR